MLKFAETKILFVKFCSRFQVEAGTVAERGNLKPGDVIVAVNGESVTSLNVAQCNEKLRKANASLYLLLIK